mgnify:CR=1 FL=1
MAYISDMFILLFILCVFSDSLNLPTFVKVKWRYYTMIEGTSLSLWSGRMTILYLLAFL